MLLLLLILLIPADAVNIVASVDALDIIAVADPVAVV